MHLHHKINYLELPVKDIKSSKRFLSAVFNWSFTDYGCDYSAFSNAGIDGGLFKSDLTISTAQGSALIVFYSRDLAQTENKIKESGGTISKPTFAFPCGYRFHFNCPSGNEYAVWTDEKPSC